MGKGTTISSKVDNLLAQQKKLYEQMSTILPDAIKEQEALVERETSKLATMKAIMAQQKTTETTVEKQQTKTMTSAVNQIGKKVRRIRKSKGLSQSQVAKRGGIAPSSLSNIERGNWAPSDDFAKKIAKGLDVPADRLMN